MARSCFDIVPQRRLRIFDYAWECPYCGRRWERLGGHAEGFRKAGVYTHVRSCWEILLYQAGFAENGTRAVPLSECEPRYIRGMKATIARRKREKRPMPAMPKTEAT